MRSLTRSGLLEVHLKVNLRFPLRLVCWYQDEHDWKSVIAGDAFSRSYRFCGRCGAGWVHNGLKKCWFPWQHRWDGRPSYALGPSWTELPDGTHKPFRDIEQCSRCHHTRVIDCATGQVIPNLR